MYIPLIFLQMYDTDDRAESLHVHHRDCEWKEKYQIEKSMQEEGNMTYLTDKSGPNGTPFHPHIST